MKRGPRFPWDLRTQQTKTFIDYKSEDIIRLTSGLQSSLKWGPTPSSFWASAQRLQPAILSFRVRGKVVIIVAHAHKSELGEKETTNI